MEPIAPPRNGALEKEHAATSTSGDSNEPYTTEATVNSQSEHDTDPEGDGHALHGNPAWARRLDALD